MELENVLWLTWPDCVPVLKNKYSFPLYCGLMQVKKVVVHYELNVFG